MMTRTLASLAFALAFFFAEAGIAGTVEDGVAAYQRGDYQVAMGLLRPEADRGDATAQAVLGALYYNGQGAPHDLGQSFSWYLKAARQGVAAAQNQVGLMYCRGQGVAQDFGQAIGWYGKAAAQGDATAEENLGLMYSAGQGAARDDAAAVRWFAAAAQQGNTAAAYNLGLMYDGGLGVAQDHGLAVAWWRRAADRGDPDAQSSLGAAYALGKGVARDDAQAYLWFTLASMDYVASDAEDREGALRNRQSVAAGLSAAQIAEAERQAHLWRPKGGGPTAGLSQVEVDLNASHTQPPGR